jgi:hypothetical protein
LCHPLGRQGAKEQRAEHENRGNRQAMGCMNRSVWGNGRTERRSAAFTPGSKSVTSDVESIILAARGRSVMSLLKLIRWGIDHAVPTTGWSRAVGRGLKPQGERCLCPGGTVTQETDAGCFPRQDQARAVSLRLPGEPAVQNGLTDPTVYQLFDLEQVI